MRRTALAPKALAVVLLVFASCAESRAQGGTAQAAPAGRFYALVVGNDDYKSLPKLKTAAADAREVERVLREAYGFRTKLLVNATRSQIVAALFAYRRELSADSNLLIYYAGHGYSDKETEKTYWLPVDATGDDNSNWIIADDITSDIKAIPARHVLVVSDSCYSGTLSRGLNLSPPPSSERQQFLRKMAE
ncbi:MAG TPA: caspase family protein, partial [Pyrinomonadaceae bacterium]|nr:caspase family protein [Pyrinomonadaceae bacterium]